MPNAPRIVIIVGHDCNGAFKDLHAYLKEHKEIQAVYAKEGESIEDTLKHVYASEKDPVNFILAAHGSEDGKFLWNNHELLSYSKLFRALPKQGSTSIIVESCYGGTSLKDMADLTAGTILKPVISDKTVSLADNFNTNLLTSGYQTIDLLVAAQLNDDPTTVVTNNKNWNRKNKNLHYTENLNAILSDSIAIGGGRGKIPQLINLPTKVAQMARSIGTNERNDKTLTYARNKVFEEINHLFLNDQAANLNGFSRTQSIFSQYYDGKIPQDPESQRIEYALAIANIYKNGELTRRVEFQKHHALPMQQEPKPGVIESAKIALGNGVNSVLDPVDNKAGELRKVAGQKLKGLLSSVSRVFENHGVKIDANAIPHEHSFIAAPRPLAKSREL